MSDLQVRDDSDEKKYFTQIPNIIEIKGLGVYAFRLYFHLKRVAGDKGKCYKSTETLAKDCGIGMASVSRAKKELIEHKLITIEKKKSKRGKPYHEIRIVNIWDENMAYFSKTSPQEVITSEEEFITSPQEIKNNPSKNKTNNKRKSRKRDVRLDHPAIIAYREEVHLHVPINLRDDVIKKVDNAEKWKDIIHNWMLKGWNKQNIEGMLDVYENGWGKNGKQQGKSAFDKVRERSSNGNA
jgi:hypothetical protein